MTHSWGKANSSFESFPVSNGGDRCRSKTTPCDSCHKRWEVREEHSLGIFDWAESRGSTEAPWQEETKQEQDRKTSPERMECTFSGGWGSARWKRADAVPCWSLDLTLKHRNSHWRILCRELFSITALWKGLSLSFLFFEKDLETLYEQNYSISKKYF